MRKFMRVWNFAWRALQAFRAWEFLKDRFDIHY